MTTTIVASVSETRLMEKIDRNNDFTGVRSGVPAWAEGGLYNIGNR